MKSIVHYIKTVTLALILLFTVGFVSAQGGWTGPGGQPPFNNVNPPLWSDGGAQTRTGKLTMNSQLDLIGGGLFVLGTLPNGWGIQVENATRLAGLYMKPNTLAIFDGPAEFYQDAKVGFGSLDTDWTTDLFVAGNVGIGTQTPAQKLEVLNGIKIGNTTSASAGSIRWTGTDFEGYTGSAWASLTGAGGGGGSKWVDSPVTPGDIYYSAGRVGVGTQAPAARLDVAGEARIQNAIQVGNTTANAAGKIRWTGTDFEGYTGSGWVSLTGGGPPSGGSLWSPNPGDPTEIYYSTGNVGIGNSNPQTNLDITGNAQISTKLTVGQGTADPTLTDLHVNGALEVGDTGRRIENIFTGWWVTAGTSVAPNSAVAESRLLPTGAVKVGSACAVGHTSTHSQNIIVTCDVAPSGPDLRVFVRWYNNSTAVQPTTSGTVYVTIFDIPLGVAEAL